MLLHHKFKPLPQVYYSLLFFILYCTIRLPSIHAAYSIPGPHDPNYCYIQWMNPPKTAPTFCLSIQHACNEVTFLQHADIHAKIRINFGCPIIEPDGTWYGNRYHKPLLPPDLPHIQRFVTMLRDPDDRLLAAFAENIHVEGLNRSSKEALYDSLEGGQRGHFAENDETCIANYLKYAAWKGSEGCYVKMLNGHECHEDQIIDAAMLDIAKKRLKSFLFVGIVEEYATSLQVFHRIAQTTMDASTFLINSNITDSYLYKHELYDAHPLEFKPLKRTRTPCLHPLLQKYAHYIPVHDHHHHVASTANIISYRLKDVLVPNSAPIKRKWRDPWDGALYEYAVELFHQRRLELKVNIVNATATATATGSATGGAGGTARSTTLHA